MRKKLIFIGAILAVGGFLWWKFGDKVKGSINVLGEVNPSGGKKPSTGTKATITKDELQTMDAPEIPDVVPVRPKRPKQPVKNVIVGIDQPVNTLPMPEPTTIGGALTAVSDNEGIVVSESPIRTRTLTARTSGAPEIFNADDLPVFGEYPTNRMGF